MLRRRWPALVAIVTVTLALCGSALLSASPVAANPTTFTWSGVDANPGWSLTDNWGGTAPSASDSGDVLDFPGDLTDGDCANATPSDSCYRSEDDIAGYGVDQIEIDDGAEDYLLQADSNGDPLTLGSGGLQATTSSTDVGGAEIGIPLELKAPQAWTIDGGAADQGRLLLDDGLSAANTSADTLAVTLQNEGQLTLNGDNEVGAVTLDGYSLDQAADENGVVSLDDANLDSADRQTVTVDGAGLHGTGTIGPLVSIGGDISPGDPTGTLAVSGVLTLDSDSAFVPLIGAGDTAAAYSQLTVTGSVSLGFSTLELQSTSASNACPTLTPGATYTLLSATGSLTGTFANVPTSGTILNMDCSGTQPQFTIDYNTSSSPQTVTATVTGPLAPTTTTLTSSGALIADGQYTLTATVSSPGGVPSGTVEFATAGLSRNAQGLATQTLSAISSCAAVPVAQSPTSASASCTFTLPAAGGESFEAEFNPAAGAAFTASTSNAISGSIAPFVTFPTILPFVASPLGLTTSFKGERVFITARCPAGSGCAVIASLSARETLSRGKIVAVTASGGRTARTVTVGGASFTISAGASKNVTLTLNGLGRTLVKQFHRLEATLTISSNGRPVLSTTVTLRPTGHG